MTTKAKTIEIVGCIVILTIICIGVILLLPNRCSNTPNLEKSNIDLTNNVKLEQSKSN